MWRGDPISEPTKLRIDKARIRHLHRPRPPMIFHPITNFELLYLLHLRRIKALTLLKIAPQTLPSPSVIPQFLPHIIIFPQCALEKHSVDSGTATYNFTGVDIEGFISQLGNGGGLEAPCILITRGAEQAGDENVVCIGVRAVGRSTFASQLSCITVAYRIPASITSTDSISAA
jgi:hypothetical protein